jgi:hypothetical protein
MILLISYVLRVCMTDSLITLECFIICIHSLFIHSLQIIDLLDIQCGKTPNELGKKKHAKCAGCGQVRFCSEVCQRENWSVEISWNIFIYLARLVYLIVDALYPAFTHIVISTSCVVCNILLDIDCGTHLFEFASLIWNIYIVSCLKWNDFLYFSSILCHSGLCTKQCVLRWQRQLLQRKRLDWLLEGNLQTMRIKNSKYFLLLMTRHFYKMYWLYHDKQDTWFSISMMILNQWNLWSIYLTCIIDFAHWTIHGKNEGLND